MSSSGPFSVRTPAELAFSYYDPANIGVALEVMASPTFWFSLLVCNLITFGARYAERTYLWAFKPQDTNILSEKERKDGLMQDLSAPTRARLAGLGAVRADLSKSAASMERGGEDALREQYASGSLASGGDLEMRGSVVGDLMVSKPEWQRTSTKIRFANHARSASGTTYTLK